jgi:hypothetical protein
MGLKSMRLTAKEDPPLPHQRVVGQVTVGERGFASPMPLQQQPVLWPPDPKHPERSQAPGSAAMVQARLALEVKVDALADLLRRADEAHRVHVQKLGADHNRPEWYAAWITANGETGLHLDEAALAKDLRSASQAITAKEWPAPYARYLLVKDAAVRDSVGSLLSAHDVIPEPKTGLKRIGEPIVKTDSESPFGSTVTTELYWSAEHGLAVKHSQPIEVGYGGEERQTFLYRFD